jgi:hypothetical protein
VVEEIKPLRSRWRGVLKQTNHHLPRNGKLTLYTETPDILEIATHIVERSRITPGLHGVDLPEAVCLAFARRRSKRYFKSYEEGTKHVFPRGELEVVISELKRKY